MRFVAGSVVLSVDYFKKFLYSLRKIVGGEARSLESLMDRGRREAVLRMKEQYPDADTIFNVRLETTNISGSNPKALGAVEVFAYGTAVKFHK